LGRPVVPDVYVEGVRLGAGRGQHLLVRLPDLPLTDPQHDVDRRLPQRLRRHRRQRGVDDQGLRAAVGEHVGDLVGDQPEVDRDADGAEPGGRDEGLHDLQPVEREDGDAVTGPDPAVGQGVRQPGDPLVPLGVAAAGALEPQRDHVGGAPGPPRQLVADGHAAALEPGDRNAHAALPITERSVTARKVRPWYSTPGACQSAGHGLRRHP
jgi:hypothetical protein